MKKELKYENQVGCVEVFDKGIFRTHHCPSSHEEITKIVLAKHILGYNEGMMIHKVVLKKGYSLKDELQKAERLVMESLKRSHLAKVKRKSEKDLLKELGYK